MNPSPPDLFPERPVRSDFSRAGPSYRTRRVITVAVVVVVLGFGLHAIFGSGSIMHSGEIATIKAEGGWKQRPQQPGGLDIPNQNVQVYQALDNKYETAKAPAEHLLPPPEVPQLVPTTVTPSNSATASTTPATPQVESLTPPKLEIDNLPTPGTDAPVPDVAPTAPTVTAAIPDAPAVVAPPIAAALTPTPAVPAVAPAAPVKAPIKTVTTKTKTVTASAVPPRTIAQVLKDVESGTKTDRAVQLASVPDQASAQAMADKLQGQYASVLGSASLHVVQADVAGKGTFYRIQSSPISDDRANSICAELKKMKAGCLLVRP